MLFVADVRLRSEGYQVTFRQAKKRQEVTGQFIIPFTGLDQKDAPGLIFHLYFETVRGMLEHNPLAPLFITGKLSSFTQITFHSIFNSFRTPDN